MLGIPIAVQRSPVIPFQCHFRAADCTVSVLIAESKIELRLFMALLRRFLVPFRRKPGIPVNHVAGCISYRKAVLLLGRRRVAVDFGKRSGALLRFPFFPLSFILDALLFFCPLPALRFFLCLLLPKLCPFRFCLLFGFGLRLGLGLGLGLGLRLLRSRLRQLRLHHLRHILLIDLVIGRQVFRILGRDPPGAQRVPRFLGLRKSPLCRLLQPEQRLLLVFATAVSGRKRASAEAHRFRTAHAGGSFEVDKGVGWIPISLNFLPCKQKLFCQIVPVFLKVQQIKRHFSTGRI